MDLASSIQVVTEEIVFRIARTVHGQTGMEKPGAGRRCGYELRGQRPSFCEGPFGKHLDSTGGRGRRSGAGGGGVRLAPTSGKDAPRPPSPSGPTGELAGATIFLRRDRTVPEDDRRRVSSFCRRGQTCSDNVSQGRSHLEKVVGWFPWPRGVWPACIQASPASWAIRGSAKMQATMNLKIKFQKLHSIHSCVLRENVHEWFTMRAQGRLPRICSWLLRSSQCRRTRLSAEDEEALKPATRTSYGRMNFL